MVKKKNVEELPLILSIFFSSIFGKITLRVNIRDYFLKSASFLPPRITVRYNSQTIQFPQLKYTILRSLVFSQGCGTITTIRVTSKLWCPGPLLDQDRPGPVSLLSLFLPALPDGDN